MVLEIIIEEDDQQTMSFNNYEQDDRFIRQIKYGRRIAMENAEDPKKRTYDKEIITEFARDDGVATFGVFKLKQDFFPEVVWNIICEFTTLDPTAWTTKDCDTYFRCKIIDVNFNMISGADLESMSFSKMETLGITDKKTQDSLALTIRNHLIGPSYYPFSWSRPRPGGKIELMKKILCSCPYFIAYLIIGPLVAGVAIALYPLTIVFHPWWRIVYKPNQQ